MRPQVIAAIIRKDLQLQWQLALIIAVLQFGTTLFFHEVTEFPGLHFPGFTPLLAPHNPLFWIGAALPALLSAVFIAVAVQVDAVTDARRDWLTRPISAGEIAAAKIALVLGVVFVPYTAGDLLFTLLNQADPALTLLPVLIILRNCLFGIMLAWLLSNMLQAVLAMIGLVTLSGLLLGFMMAVLATLYYVGRAHAGLPITGVPEIQPTLPNWPRVSLQTALVVVVTWPVLWLLLARRKVATARLLFFVAFVAAGTIPYTQMKVTEPVKKAKAAHLVIETPIRETRHE
jgi:hypothetical protein